MSSKFIFNPHLGTIDRVFQNGNIRKNIGTPDGGGYMQITILHKRYMAHRLMWNHVHGEIPEGLEIDHINGKKTDNRIENLRLVTHKQNQENWRQAPVTNVTSGVKGVSFYPSSMKWRAQIKHNNRNHHLGYFESIDAAQSAYAAAAAKLHTHNPCAK